MEVSDSLVCNSDFISEIDPGVGATIEDQYTCDVLSREAPRRKHAKRIYYWQIPAPLGSTNSNDENNNNNNNNNCCNVDVCSSMTRSIYRMDRTEACDFLGIAETTLRRYYRKSGLVKWPYRKIRLLDIMVKQLMWSTSKDAGERIAIQCELENALAERSDLMSKVDNMCSSIKDRGYGRRMRELKDSPFFDRILTSQLGYGATRGKPRRHIFARDLPRRPESALN